MCNTEIIMIYIVIMQIFVILNSYYYIVISINIEHLIRTCELFWMVIPHTYTSTYFDETILWTYWMCLWSLWRKICFASGLIKKNTCEHKRCYVRIYPALRVYSATRKCKCTLCNIYSKHQHRNKIR